MSGINDSTRISAVDLAFKRFQELKTKGQLLPRGDKWSESDTRAKVITPMFRDILGWAEPEIRREKPVAKGFVDYVVGLDFSYFHIEAKRNAPRFELQAPLGTRIVNVSGPHLLKNTNVKKHLIQTASYAFSLGTEYAVLTNGHQYIIFRPHIRGRNWEEGKAIVFLSLDDIESHFAEFWRLLSRDSVRGGSLIQAFEAVEAVTVRLSRALDVIHNPDMELVRNPFWNDIADVVSPLLIDDPLNRGIQEEIIKHCYVKTAIADETDLAIDKLLRGSLPKHLEDAKFTNIEIGMQDRSSFDRHVEEDIKDRNLGTYILTGGVGSGKTTFLRRFVTEVAPSFVKKYCVWLHIDYLPIGSVAGEGLSQRIKDYTFKQIRRILLSSYMPLYPTDGGKLRELFAQELTELYNTKLYGVDPKSERWKIETNALVAALAGNDEELVQHVLPSLASRGLRVVIVLDNTDQQGEKFQETMFLFSQALSRNCGAMTIIALREEKFFAAYRRGVFDAYGQRRFHIGSPDLKSVIRSRLEYALKTLAESKRKRMDSGSNADIAQVLQCLIQSTVHRKGDIARYLACLSNGDMRLALGWFKEFMSSGNTDVEKIKRIIKKSGGYTVPLHEFVKSAVLGTRRYYSANRSHVVNLFSRAPTTTASNLTTLRILARMANAMGAPSAHGEGFIATPQLLKEYRVSFGNADDFVLRATELLSRGLLESEPPRALEVENTEALRLSAAGAYYFNYLAHSFAYIDLVFVDTPMDDLVTVNRLAELAPHTDFGSRFERVRLFLKALCEVEKAELESVALREGVYKAPIMDSIVKSIENEIELIAAKNKFIDSGGRWRENE